MLLAGAVHTGAVVYSASSEAVLFFPLKRMGEWLWLVHFEVFYLTQRARVSSTNVHIFFSARGQGGTVNKEEVECARLEMR